MSMSESKENAELVALNVEQSALPESEKQAFAAAERRAESGATDLSHKTVREIIDEQQSFEDAERASQPS